METKQRKVFLFAPFRLPRARAEYTGRKIRQATVKEAITKRTVLEHAAKEREWRQQKSEYESYIMALEAERDARPRNGPKHQITLEAPKDKVQLPPTLEDEALKNQTKAVLLAELISMELFYGLDDLLRHESTGIAQGVTSGKLYSLTDKDLLLHSAETLLELTEYFFAKSTLANEENGKKIVLRGLDSQDGNTDLPSRSLHRGNGSLHSTPIAESSYERKLLRVRESLSKLKRTTDSAALGFLSRLLDTKLDESEKGLQEYKKRLYELLKQFVKSPDSSADGDGTPIDSVKLEQSLCHVLMDKAILNCLLLLDKADMESRIKTLVEQQTRFDYTGFSSMTSGQFECSSQCSDDYLPSPPLSGRRSGDGRLISVDEGVVLESLSDSANSREKLSVHLENTTEELEAENKRLYEKNEELRKRYEQAEGEKTELTLKILEYERKLERSERKLNSLMQTENADEVELKNKVKEKDFETDELFARVEELEDELQLRDEAVVVLKENERKLREQLSDERKRSDEAEERSAKLQLKIRQLDDKLEQSELKLASFTGSDLLESNKVTKHLENLIAENKALKLKIFQLEEKMNETSGLVSASPSSTGSQRDNDQKKIHERKIIELEVKLKEQQVKILSVKEYERRLRAELCKEMTKKLTRAQTRSRELGEKIFELEAKLRQAEEQYTTVKGLDMNVKSAMRDDIKTLTDKLKDAEARNRDLNASIQDIEERLRLSQREVLEAKQSQIDLRERAQLLEMENCKMQEKLLSRKEEKTSRSSTGRTADRLEKLRKENSKLTLELKSFRENILKLEREMLEKDQEILNLRNESVDLSSEVCKLKSELDDSGKDRAHLERNLLKSTETEQRLVAKLALLQEEVEKIRASKPPTTDGNEQVAETDCKSESTASTLVIGEDHHEAKTVSEEVVNDELNKKSQEETEQLLSDHRGLQAVIDELRHENARMVKENEQLIQEIKTLETNLSVVEKTFQVCRSENECLLQEVNLKSAEATTLRTYASFCSEKAKEMRSEIASHRENEATLEKRLTDLERESALMQNEMGHGILEFSELKEKKESLEKKIVEASRVVDHLKQEMLVLINGVLTLQRDLGAHVDKIITCLGLDAAAVQHFRMRPTSVDSSDALAQTAEESSSEVSSEVSENFSWKSLFAVRLLPDNECFLNPSDVSIIRENKMEIQRLYEDLKAKVLAIKDALSQERDIVHGEKLGVDHTYTIKREREADILMDTSKSSTVLPRLSKAERVKLSSLLSRLKEELVRERQTNNDGRTDGDGSNICLLYDNLENKLSRLSCELAIKEDEITQLLNEKTQLQNELEECERGITTCQHCASKASDELEESTNQLKGKLLSHMQDTSRLEGEICEFMEYRERLEEELIQIKGKITEMEDELDVRKILIERCIGSRPPGHEMEVTNSESSREETDFKSSPPGKKRKSPKRVTFENVDNESENKSTNKRRRQKPDLLSGQDFEELLVRQDVWRSTDMEGSDIDLCELLASIPRDIPKATPTKEELEITEMANRLSGYDNLSFDDKVEYASAQRKKCEADSEITAALRSSLVNDVPDEVGVDYGDDGQVTCQMCGLFKTRS